MGFDSGELALRHTPVTSRDELTKQRDPAFAAHLLSAVLQMIGPDTAVAAVGVLPVGLLPHLATYTGFQGIFRQTEHLHDALAIALLAVFVLIEGFQVAGTTGNGIQQHQVIALHPARRIRHDLRRHDQIGRIALETQPQAEVETGSEGMDIGIIRNGQEQTDRLGLQRTIEVDGLPLERLALPAFLPEPLSAAARPATAAMVDLTDWHVRRHGNTAIAAECEPLFRCPLLSAKGHDTCVALVTHIDLAQDNRRTVLNAKGQTLVTHGAGRCLLGEIKTADDMVKFTLPLFTPVCGLALIMLHVRQRLRACKLQKPPLLAPVQL